MRTETTGLAKGRRSTKHSAKEERKGSKKDRKEGRRKEGGEKRGVNRLKQKSRNVSQ